ncbi:urease accessory protein UreD [Marinobacterium mangrovicola]|uniref:Urease accessory protein UreD n=1 Tax=Marinobacterium mangrovicola TaxID=1476959 RepID=A0A4R1GPN5_9GAMM|nr:urease accessory protein UreD [Marinobacterium mangrovicola]TCK09290.1 urease accessory protein [Marinobacterium mangrovicola]
MNMAVTAQGWEALLKLRFALRGEKTKIVERERKGPLAVQRPFYPEGDEVCHTYLLHPPGGVVGSDTLDIAVHVEPGAKALITTPGATKFYRSGGRLATQIQRLSVEKGGLLEWMPQENIFFPDAQARVETHIDLEPGASFIGWDIQCLGRPVIDEAFTEGRLDATTRLSVDGELVLIDQLRTEGMALVEASAGMRGYPMQATMLIVPGQDNPDFERLLELTREAMEGLSDLPLEAGATRVDQAIVVRLLGPGTEPMLKLMTAVWRAVRPEVAGREAEPPRIWAT